MITSHDKKELSLNLFGKTRRVILTLLYGQADEPFYLRQIVRLTGAGLGPVQRELKGLTASGIISRTIQGKQVYYQANKKCPIFAELKSIITKTAGAVSVLKAALQPVKKKIILAFIFGSIASSTEERMSDIDIMVVGETTFSKIVSLLSPAQMTLGREINPVVYPDSEFKRKIYENHHFLKTVLEGDKIFLIGDEDELTRLVEKRAIKST